MLLFGQVEGSYFGGGAIKLLLANVKVVKQVLTLVIGMSE
jgi:hypothetical protein